MTGSEARRLLATLRDGAPAEEEAQRGVEAVALAAYQGGLPAAERASEGLGAVLSHVQARADLAGRIALLGDISGPRPDKFLAALREVNLAPSLFISATGRPLVGAAKRSTARAWEQSGDDLLKALSLDVVPAGFYDAIRDLEERPALLGAAEEVQRVYGGYRDPVGHRRVFPHGFALARSASLEVTRKVQATLARALREGKPLERTIDLVREAGDFTKGYALTVTRTNLATAYSAGRHREASRLRERGVDAGFTFTCANDERVRRGRKQDNHENHLALDGVSAPADDPIWGFFSPPGGFSCRCVGRPRIGGPWTRDALATARVLGAKFAPGFGRNPALVSYAPIR